MTLEFMLRGNSILVLHQPGHLLEVQPKFPPCKCQECHLTTTQRDNFWPALSKSSECCEQNKSIFQLKCEKKYFKIPKICLDKYHYYYFEAKNIRNKQKNSNRKDQNAQKATLLDFLSRTMYNLRFMGNKNVFLYTFRLGSKYLCALAHP